MAQNINEGIYFLHLPFLKEVNDSWLNRGNIGKPAKTFMAIFFAPCHTELAICNRTLSELEKPKYTFKSAPAFYDMFVPKSAPTTDGEVLDDDEYALRVASLQKSREYPLYFITSDEQNGRMAKLAKTLGYSINILSPRDFQV